MSSRRPTDDCLALLEVLLWNHFLPASLNATAGPQEHFLQTSATRDRQIASTYLDWPGGDTWWGNTLPLVATGILSAIPPTGMLSAN